MINFSEKEINYIKNELKAIVDFIASEEYKKEYGCVEIGKEDKELLEKYSKDTTDWDNVNTDVKINKDIENVCESLLGCANYWIRKFSVDEVLDITGDKIYSDIYGKVGGEEW